jgi:HAD superfamily hydrolase (TIGR01549 family)
MNKASLENKKVFIFDLDGTIVDLQVDWMELKSFLKKRYSRIYENSCEFDSISGCLSYIVAMKDENELEKFFEIIRDHELRNIEKNEYINETVYFIKNLDKFKLNDNLQLAVLSLNTRETIIKSLEMVNIKEKFDIILGREDVRRWKPEPEGLLKIQQALNVKKEEMIYFGDMKKDLLTGRNAGVESHLIGDLIKYVNAFKKKNNLD